MVASNATHEIRVEAYRGPLDLLLYLIKDEEVDIYDIPIARILERYLEELAKMETVDINAAADFLLMAATLMEIKSRQMLPPEEREDVEIDEDDPRSDLVRQLLEYRRFRQAADELGESAIARSRMFGRAEFAMGIRMEESEEEVDPSEELRGIEIFDLLATFENLMKAILADVPRTIIYDDISVEERIEELVMALRERAEQVRFTEFSHRAIDRADAAGIFTAILEATRRKLVTIYQTENLGELYVSLRGERPDSDFTPPPEELDVEPPRRKHKWGQKTERFSNFMDAEEAEDDDVEFAFDVEGRKAISRLEAAVQRADEAIENLSKPKPSAEGPVVRQWTDENGQVHEVTVEENTGTEAEAEKAPAASEGPQTIIIRHWTDPDRRGTVVVLGGAGAASDDSQADKPLVIGHFKYVARRIQLPRSDRGRKQSRRLVAGAMPFKPRARQMNAAANPKSCGSVFGAVEEAPQDEDPKTPDLLPPGIALEVRLPHMGRRIEESHLGAWGPMRRRILENG